MTRVRLLGLLGFAALAAYGLEPRCALAGDSTIELAIGGLTFSQNADVAMDSEDVTITPQSVRVRYQFVNQSATPVTLTIAFPMPDIDLTDPDTDIALPADDPLNFVGFQTRINGKPVKFDIRQRAMIGTKDVTDAVRAAGLVVLPIGAQTNRYDELPEETKKRLADDGLLLPAGTNDKGMQLYDAGWTVKTSIVRKQTFPPGQPISVEHRYKTSVGVSLDTVLRKAIREKESMAAEFKRYVADYCISDFFMRGIDRRAGAEDANIARLKEFRISYGLKTAANGPGPVKHFRLVVDKGRADRLVSFCADNVTKISPTSFEMKADDFTPARDLKILLIGTVE